MELHLRLRQRQFRPIQHREEIPALEFDLRLAQLGRDPVLSGCRWATGTLRDLRAQLLRQSRDRNGVAHHDAAWTLVNASIWVCSACSYTRCRGHQSETWCVPPA